eukprot:1170145-Pleurochrysis_carterae.AAC.2
MRLAPRARRSHLARACRWPSCRSMAEAECRPLTSANSCRPVRGALHGIKRPCDACSSMAMHEQGGATT